LKKIKIHIKTKKIFLLIKFAPSNTENNMRMRDSHFDADFFVLNFINHATNPLINPKLLFSYAKPSVDPLAINSGLRIFQSTLKIA
jgi:hypothetical protein